MHNPNKVKQSAHSLSLLREYLLELGECLLVFRVFVVILAIVFAAFVSPNSHAQSLSELGLPRRLDLALNLLVRLASTLLLVKREFADHVYVLDDPQACLLGKTWWLQLQQRLPSATQCLCSTAEVGDESPDDSSQGADAF